MDPLDKIINRKLTELKNENKESIQELTEDQKKEIVRKYNEGGFPNLVAWAFNIDESRVLQIVNEDRRLKTM